jgi:hypothetical protein
MVADDLKAALPEFGNHLLDKEGYRATMKTAGCLTFVYFLIAVERGFFTTLRFQATAGFSLSRLSRFSRFGIP